MITTTPPPRQHPPTSPEGALPKAPVAHPVSACQASSDPSTVHPPSALGASIVANATLTSPSRLAVGAAHACAQRVATSLVGALGYVLYGDEALLCSCALVLEHDQGHLPDVFFILAAAHDRRYCYVYGRRAGRGPGVRIIIIIISVTCDFFLLSNNKLINAGGMSKSQSLGYLPLAAFLSPD